MAVKRKILKAEFDALSDDKKEFYIENKDRKGEFVLDLGDDEDNPLKSAYERVKADKTSLETQLAEANTALETEKARKAPKDGTVTKDDHEAMKASYETKLAAQVTKHTAEVAKKDGVIRTQLIDNVAKTMAGEISTSPKVMLPHIRSRLAVEFGDDGAKTVVLDADGKPSAYTLDELKQEFVANKDFSGILIGSKGSGGNAPQPAHPGNAHNSPSPNAPVRPADMVAQMRARHPDLP